MQNIKFCADTNYHNKFILSKKEIKNYENNNNPIAGLSDKGTP